MKEKQIAESGVAWEVGWWVREKDLTLIWKRNGKGREGDWALYYFHNYQKVTFLSKMSQMA
jgi:hypothetical protein